MVSRARPGQPPNLVTLEASAVPAHEAVSSAVLITATQSTNLHIIINTQGFAEDICLQINNVADVGDAAVINIDKVRTDVRVHPFVLNSLGQTYVESCNRIFGVHSFDTAATKPGILFNLLPFCLNHYISLYHISLCTSPNGLLSFFRIDMKEDQLYIVKPEV